jgi:nucleotide-binding universal stress UspA family protein
LDQIVGSLDTEGIETEKKVLIGDAHEQIVETAEKGAYDLIILGHRGLNPVKRFFMGSTAKKVMEDAPCSVMIVK